MKDLPHHVKQLNRKIIRSEKREENQEEEKAEELIKKEAKIEASKEQLKKKTKLNKKKIKTTHTPHPQTPEERNKLMKKRVPIVRERSHHPRNSK
jgi:hypothetical protein